jgi:hypothetical protein
MTQCGATPPCDELEQTRSQLAETERLLGQTRRRVTLLEEAVPKLDALAMEFTRVVKAVETKLELLRIEEQETAQTATLALRRASRNGGQVVNVFDDDDDEPTADIPIEKIMRHPAARELVQRELAAQEKLREKEDQDEMDAREKRRAAFWTRVYQAVAIVGTLGTLAKLFGIWH